MFLTNLLKFTYYNFNNTICSFQPESIQRDLRQVFVTAANFGPSVVILENIDILAKFNVEHTQDGEYFNK
jgi:hypothetical protein